MSRHPSTRHRRSLRLKGYDYARAGAYFVTICTQNRACLFGEVVDGKMRLNEAGWMVLAEWNALSERFLVVELDAFAVMPNHVHGIIVITNDPVDPVVDPVGAGLVPAPNTAAPDGATTNGATTNGVTTRVAPTLGDVVGAFKSRTTVLFASGVKQRGWPAFPGRLWQRNYYERIIRDEPALARIREYIANNPRQWTLDRLNPRHAEIEDAGLLRRPTP